MKYYPTNKILLTLLSTPFFSAYLYAESFESVATLAPIIVKAEDDDESTEKNKKYIKSKSSQATKMNISLKETPQTVTVVTQQRIQDQGLNTIAEVMQQVPGVSIGYNDSERPNYNVRGFAVDNIQIDGIASSYTGVSGSVIAMPVFDTAIYDHIEVLKGVNGLNTGLGEPSASINMVHKKPTQEFNAGIGASYDTFDGRRFTGDISGGLLPDDKLNARLIVAKSEGGTAKNNYEKNTTTISGSLTSKLTEKTLLTLGIDYQNDNPHGLGGGVPIFYSDGSKTNFASKDNFGSMNWVRWQRELQNSYIDLDHQFNDKWKAKLSYSRQDLDAFAKTSYAYNGNLNRDGTGLSYSQWASEGDLSQNTYDFTVTGLFYLFNREHQIVFGVNGWDRDTNEYGLSYPAYSASNTINDFENFYGDASPDFHPKRTGVDKTTDTKMFGTFINTRWNITDQFKFFIGGRLSDWETKTKNFNQGQLTSITSDQKQSNIFVPYVAATYDILPTSTIYTSYTEIFKPQSNLDIHGNFLEPVTGSNTELGLKNSFFDDRLDLNAAIFYTRKDNVAKQIEGTGVNGIEARYRAVKGAKTKGFEIEVLGQLTDAWTIAFGYAYNDTEDAQSIKINTANPKQTAKLNTNYQFNGELSGLRIGGSLNWYGSSYDYINMGTRAQPNLIKAEQQDYFIASLYGAYDINNRARVSLNINNLFDEKYYTRIISSYKTGYMGDGRSAVVTLNYTF
ncbi:TonB-dependent siderophore receptor [Acinetobacter sp. MD2(2019)]|uniref:TonB-dependent siderophore receptor n=1 Tax=Acinetobacter sp. MD2(2019) TaxID=2605273 RepID=UPI002D1E5019|nr:TonB-dependent siderophore receptor [Acinetobacter sp. MD2(2019)]MEB3753763.1 TonB-dependent siderophore receptor [Acinetobacter sp. MD2(2019)]